MRFTLSKHCVRAFALFSLFCALLAVCYVWARIPLENTLLSHTTPRALSSGWRKQTALGDIPLCEASRCAAGRLKGTLRLTNVLPVSLSGNLSLGFQTKNESVRVWVGDKLVYAYGKTPQRAYGHGVGAVWNLAPLPENAGGQPLTVELTPIGGRVGLAPYRFLLGSHDGLISALLRENRAQLCACVLLTIIVVGSMALALVLKWRGDGRATGAFHFFMYVLLATVWMATDSGLTQFLIANKGVSYLLFGCSFYLFCTPFSLFMANMLPKRRRLFYAFAMVNSGYAVLRIALYVLGVLDFEAGLWGLHLLMTAFILVTNHVLWSPVLRTRKFEQRELCYAVTAFTVVAGVSLVLFYAQNKLNVQRNGYSSGFYLGILLFVLIVAAGAVKRADQFRQQAFKAAFFERRAYTDDLTGLLNVKGFDDKCAAMLQNAPADRCCAVVDFDVNFFSQFNANNGLDAGDELLKRIACSLRGACLADELCARQEADHFVCAVRGRSLEEILERIRLADLQTRERMAARMLLLSYGVAEVRNRALSPATLRNHALVAKHTVKGNYEQNVAVYDYRLHEEQLKEMELLSGFEAALKNNEYVIFLQPKISAATETLRGAEALVRRYQPDGSILSAGSIIKTLESKGFVEKLDFYILEQVCRFLRRCLDEGKRPCPVSSNFSRVHLFDPEFPARVAQTVNRYEIPHELVELELTETAFLVGKHTLQAVVSSLHEYGFRVAIDDFGSGYSSLNMLKDVEVDVIKLDAEFLAGATDNVRAGAVIEHTLRLAQEMKIVSVAEGVEKAEQAEYLRLLGCDLIQGYFYSRPLSQEDFTAKYLSA